MINIDYSAITGSRLYGYAAESSDTDIRGFVLPEPRYRYGLPGLTFQQQHGPGDTVIYNLKDYLSLVAKGNTSLLEILFAPKDLILKITPVGQKILDNKNILISRAFYKSIRGYAYAELRKARAVELKESRADNKTKLFVDFCSAFNLNGRERTDIIEKLQESSPDWNPLVEENSSHLLTGKRKESYDKYGYCSKNAAHCLRLLSQGIELLRSKIITFPRPDANFLLAVRSGEVSWSEIESRYHSLEIELDRANLETTLPYSCNQNVINKLYLDLVK